MECSDRVEANHAWPGHPVCLKFVNGACAIITEALCKPICTKAVPLVTC